MKNAILLLAAGLMLAGCEECKRVDALDAKTWMASEWISVANAPVAGETERKHQRSADGTSVFRFHRTNAQEVVSAKWMTAGLGVYNVFVNGKSVGKDFLKPGFTHYAKTKRSFTYDITPALRKGAGEANDFGVEVSAGWWRDKIVEYAGKKSAFRGVIEFTYADGTTELVGSKASDWFGEVAGPVKHAGIFDGEEYDAREEANCARQPQGAFAPGGCERNDEFKGEILPDNGAEIVLRGDLAMKRGPYTVKPGETLVVDFGQNCAGVPGFLFSAKRGTVLTALPGEMLNDADKGRRGCDGPKGSIYRENLRMPTDGMRVVYTFSGEGDEAYVPSYTFFGYRYLSITATDEVEIKAVVSVPVTSITKEMETGRLETGVADVNKLILNVYWGQLSNYLSVPTDCPQRNERLGWTADTQVFCEAGAFNADTSRFFRKWTRDLRDSQHEKGGFSSVAPFALGGNESMRFGWADAGIIVPYRIWKQFGDTRIVAENFAAMEKYLAHVEETRYAFDAIKDECAYGQYADWLSFEDYEQCNGSAYERDANGARRLRPDTVRYWNYLGACYWLMDAQMLAEMSAVLGQTASARRWGASAARARAYIRENFVDPQDGLLIAPFRHLQSAALFALHCGILADARAVEATKAAYRKNLADHGGCSMTGFLGTSILMDTLTENGMVDVAYDLLLNHAFPSWLYSVDQGATTIWERWNSYTKKDGFGPVGMNSFNHYAYGAVLAWIYKTAAGIAADLKCPGFKNVIMAPKPDRRLGFVKASYRSAAGLVKSAWRYEGEKWIWDFTIPEGATASVTLPGESEAKHYMAGTYHLEKTL